jgi:hypothetical protein
MYRGFNLELSLDVKSIEEYYSAGEKLYLKDKAQVGQSLSKFILSDNSLDGGAIQSAWFPQVEAQIFISHSHEDQIFAIALAGWLWNKFKLKAFVDSCIWGHASDLIRIIDNKYCLRPTGIYSYAKRNISTSHVHMMLSSALAIMLDRTECLFFINTPQSIKPYRGIPKTESPWIYSEIVLTQIIEKRIPERLKKMNETRFYGFHGTDIKKGIDFVIKHSIELKHLANIDVESLNQWGLATFTGNALDELYRQNPLS